MIDLYLQQALAMLPTGMHPLAGALLIVVPVLLIAVLLLVVARAMESLIYRYTLPRRGVMRTADARQTERDVEELLWRGAHGFEHTYPMDDPRPRIRAGSNPFPQPDDERRRP